MIQGSHRKGGLCLARRYLHEIDLMRAFVILGVLSVHTTSFFNVLNNDMTPGFLTLGALITTMHYTRETFMFVTGLVLFITYYRNPFNPLVFWRKRFLLIAIPYIIWTLAYIAFVGLLTPGFDWSWSVLWPAIEHNLLTGNMYFLYFLVVSMQLYIVFPFLLYMLRRWEKYHIHILIASFVLQISLMWLNKYALGNVNTANLSKVLYDLYQYRDRNIIMYQFWFISGGILACHYDRVAAFIYRHRRALFVSLGIGVCLVWGYYFLERLAVGESEGSAELVLQPIMVPYSLLVTLVYWYAGMSWAKRMGRPGWRPFSKFVKVAGNTSFGIYLAQPFPLYLMELTVNHIDGLGIPTWLHYALLPVSILFVYFSSMLISYIFGKIPLLTYTVGRRTQWRHHKHETVQHAA
ncbi:acyltransferase 3 [Alicyclobacillus hesperidum URH17-3-68]|nr:acyltransferase 3 [Alicyclobacillus hesperidum URH17-3-68]